MAKTSWIIVAVAILIIIVGIFYFTIKGIEKIDSKNQEGQNSEEQLSESEKSGEITQQETTSEQTPDTISSQELALHNTAEDCWIVYAGKVYDFTNTKMHPNMAKTVYTHCGQLTGFEEGAKSRHSGSSKERVQNYGEYLGDLS
jgi:predicted metalloprotease